jgi:hypothetical protein
VSYGGPRNYNPKDQSHWQAFAIEQRLMPWETVAKRWHELSGQRISKQRCWQIAQRAEEKIRQALRGEASNA